MRKHQRIWLYFQQHRVASMVVGHVSVVTMLGLLLLGNTMGMHIFEVFAQSPCSSGDHAYRVVSGDTLGVIAARNNTSWQKLASYNHIANPNLIYVDQTICIPGHGSGGGGSGGPPPVKGTGNYFPYGQCTWYANQRYHQLHGIYVPWTTNSDAWAWSNRAHDFHWRISGMPSPGAIVDLQPWVQGAYGLGHVAVVERILPNGHVIASNQNWGVYYWQVTDVEFSPGPGVSFISF
jgi:LysM repeat protein